MRAEVLRQVDGNWWNQKLGSSPHGVVYQTYHWAEFLREYMGCDVYYAICYDSAGSCRGLLAFQGYAPLHLEFLERPVGSLVNKILKRLYPVCSWLEGPVLLGQEGDWPDVVEELLAEVIRFAGMKHMGRFTIPLDLGSHIPGKTLQSLRRSSWATYRLDLTPPSEELWKGLKPSARKSLKRARKDGITVEAIQGEAGRRDFQSFREHCQKARGVRSFSVENLLVRYRWLEQIDGEEMFIAKHQDRPISSLGIFRFNGVLYEFGANQDPRAASEKLYGGDLIRWEIIQRGHARGDRCYDFSGVNPGVRNEKEEGIARFKKKWGGTYVEYPMFSGR